MSDQSHVWRSLSEQLVQRYADSSWRLLTTLTILLGLPLIGIFLLRGFRGAILALVVLLGLPLVAAVFEYPYKALVFTLFIAYSGLDAIIPGPVTLFLLAILSIRIFYDILDGKSLDWGTPMFRVSLSVQLAIALASIFVSRSLVGVWVEVQHIAVGLASYLAISHFVRRTPQVTWVLLAVSAGFCWITLRTVIGLLTSGGIGILQHLAEVRMGNGGWDANVAAMLANCLIPPTVYSLWYMQGKRRLALMAILILLIVAVVLTASRMGMGMLGGVLVLMLLRAPRNRVVALSALAAVGILIALYLPDSYWVRFASIGQLGGIVVDRSLQLRQHALSGGWELFLMHPWLGVGLGNFSVMSPTWMSASLMAHNSFLEVLASIGFFGFAAYLLWWWSGLEMLARARRLFLVAGDAPRRSLAETLMISLLVFYAAAQTLSVPFYGLLWVLLGLANAVRLCAERGSD